MAWLFLAGIVSGVTSTLTGLGGGMFMTLLLAIVYEPAHALVMTAPPLLLGNLQRVWLFRKWISVKRVWPLAMGAIAGSLLFGLLVADVPELVLDIVLVVVPALAIARELDWLRWNPSARVVVPAAFVAGGMNALSCGGGVVLAPTVLAAGFRDQDYIGTVSLIAVGMHLARLVGYGRGGLLAFDDLIPEIVALAVGVFVGNWLGSRIRLRVQAKHMTACTYVVLVVCAGLSVAGLA